MKNAMLVLNEEVKGMNKVLEVFKKPNYIFSSKRVLNQIEPVKSNDGQLQFVSVDSDEHNISAISIAILDGCQSSIDDIHINGDMQYQYENEVNELRINNFKNENEFHKFDLKELISAYSKISFIKPYNHSIFYIINNDELVISNSIVLGRAKLKTSLDIEFPLTKNILEMLKKVNALKIVTSSSVAVMNNIIYFNISCGKYNLKIASHRPKRELRLSYKSLFDMSYKTAVCNTEKYLTIFNDFKNIVSLLKDKEIPKVHLTKNALYLVTDHIICKHENILDIKLKSNFTICFRQDYVLNILKANKKSPHFTYGIINEKNGMIFNFNDVSYILMPIISKISYDTLQAFEN